VPGVRSEAGIECPHLNVWQNMNMKIAVSLFSIVVVASAALAAVAAPVDDLASPSQTVRDEASEKLRAGFRSTPKSKWLPLIEKIKVGQSKKEILELIPPCDGSFLFSAGSGQSHSDMYRLDGEWIIVCAFRNEGETLLDIEIRPSMKHVWVPPPEGFTGKWIVYYINGQKSHEISYKDGQYFGDFTSYHLNGAKCVIQHYTEKGIDGAEIGYHPSGKIAYRGQYKDSKEVGTWTCYDEDGKVTSTKEHPEPK
jgi:hypothetical protein